MNKETPGSFAIAAAKNVKTEENLNDFRKMLNKVTVE